MNIIVNVDKNWAIGNKGSLLFPISADLKNFRRLTEHRVVIMGRATLESLPGGAPLKNRLNIVLSSCLQAPGGNENLFVCRSLAQLEELVHTPPFADFSRDDFFVIGGQRVYTLLLPLCRTAYVTKVDCAAPCADAFFPNLDNDTNWLLTEKSAVQQQGEIPFYFTRYQRSSPLL